MEVRELVTKLGFNVDSSKLKSFEKNISTVRNSMTVAVAAFSAFGAGLFYLTKNISDMGDALAKNSARVGLSISDLQKYSYAAELAGTNLETFRNGITRFSRNLVDSKTGVGEALKAFEALKLDPKNFKDTNDAFLQIADKFKGMKNGYEKTAIAQQLFGKSGAQLINLLNEGSESIKNQGLELESLGAIISDDFARTSEDFNDSMLRMKTFILGLKISIAEELMPVFNDMMHETIAWAKANKDLIKSKIKDYVHSLAEGLKSIVKNIGLIKKVFIFLAGIWAFTGLIKIVTSLIAIFNVLKGVVYGFYLLTASAYFWILPLSLMLGGIALVLEDIWQYTHGGDSILGDLIKENKWKSPTEALMNNLEGFKYKVQGLFTDLRITFFEGFGFDPILTFTKITKFFENLFTQVGDILKNALTNAIFDSLSFIASNMGTIKKVGQFGKDFYNQGIVGAVLNTLPTSSQKQSGNTVEQNIEFRPEINVNMNGSEGGRTAADTIADKVREETSKMFRNAKRDLETAGV